MVAYVHSGEQGCELTSGEGECIGATGLSGFYLLGGRSGRGGSAEE